MAKQITVTITEAGAVVETAGFRGKTCEQETEALERALGRTTSNRATAEARLVAKETAGARR